MTSRKIAAAPTAFLATAFLLAAGLNAAHAAESPDNGLARLTQTDSAAAPGVATDDAAGVDDTAKLARDAYALSRHIIDEAQKDFGHVMTEMQRIAKYEPLVWLGQHVGLLNGNYALVAHNAVPMMLAACGEAVEAAPNSEAQKIKLNNCFGGIRTGVEFNMFTVDPDHFNTLWARKLTQDLNAVPQKQNFVPSAPGRHI